MVEWRSRVRDELLTRIHLGAGREFHTLDASEAPVQTLRCGKGTFYNEDISDRNVLCIKAVVWLN